MVIISQIKYLLIVTIVLLTFSNASGSERMPVWIDADPACGLRPTDDVDDCWAILYAIKSRKLDIVGISTVFGNVSIDEAHRTLSSLLEMPASDGEKTPVIYKGSGVEISETADDNSATYALHSLLKKRKLTIIALGPLTNIGILLTRHPDIAENINGIVAVAGNRPNQRRFFIGDSKLMHFHDMNFKKDPKAFEVVLNSKVPLTLLPFEAAEKVTMTARDLQVLSNIGKTEKKLAKISQKWLQFWKKQFNTQGFYPFDCLAVGYQLMPQVFSCESVSAQIKWRESMFVNRNELQVSNNNEDISQITYCYDVSDSFKKSLLTFHNNFNRI